MSIAVIGLGNIGKRVLEEIRNKPGMGEAIGIDVDRSEVKSLNHTGAREKLDSPKDAYIICVYTTEQVFDALKSLEYKNKPLILVESTIIPGSETEMADFVLSNGGYFVLCPQRFFAGDDEHGIFNQKRLIAGASEESLNKGMEFYARFMRKDMLIPTDLKHASLSKVVENAYRFSEIALAEELRTICESNGYDFNELRRCANTKWNMNIKEAREGVGGKCLPKDMEIFNHRFGDNRMFKEAFATDKRYRDRYEGRKD